jgi:serine phosphatase RsbU (regulator of sigma subunit)
MKELDPVLTRQLKRLGLEGITQAPTLEQFQQLLERVSDQYKHATDDRSLLTRSIDLSTDEMNTLRTRVESERDRLQAIVGAIAEALGTMGAASNDGADAPAASDATGLITKAKRVFGQRLKGIFSEGGHSADESSRVRVIETGFIRLADQIETMLQQMTSTASMKKELEVARTVQQMLLPPNDVIEREGVTIAAYCQPAQECGGDWWNVQELADGRLLSVVGDVTGHGIASAILTGTAKAAADLAHLVTRGKVQLNVLLHLMNHAIHQAGHEKVLMTATAGVLDPTTKELTYANAGHVFPYLVRGADVRPLVAHGPPLGSAAANDYPLSKVQLEKGDTVVWFTDGLTELENEAGEQFSDKRLRALCQRAQQLPARDFRDELVRSLLTFAGGRPAADDITVVVTRID